jgi:hypothetical protein
MGKLLAAAFGAALCASHAFAQDKQAPAKKATTEQQQRTDECTKQARDRNLQGRERNQFMSACMRGEKPK